jgi:hypothetical protein
MFEKSRERLERLEQTHETFRTVVQHIHKHQSAYIAGPACLAIGFVGGKYFQRPIDISIENAPVINLHPM